MKAIVKSATILFLILFLCSGTVWADSFVLTDNYIGPGATNSGYVNSDVIGNLNDFDILGLNATISSDLLKVDIYSTYFDNSIGRYDTELGDLFISVDGYSGEGEGWEFAAVLDNYHPQIIEGKASGSVSLYDTTDGVIVLSNVSHSNYIYRAGQEVQFTPHANANAIATGAWGIDDNWLSIYIAGEDILPVVTEVGFHYAMTCGNDVIEGGVAPVPEPATMLLLGTGLIGLAGISRRKRKNQA